MHRIGLEFGYSVLGNSTEQKKSIRFDLLYVLFRFQQVNSIRYSQWRYGLCTLQNDLSTFNAYIFFFDFPIFYKWYLANRLKIIFQILNAKTVLIGQFKNHTVSLLKYLQPVEKLSDHVDRNYFGSIDSVSTGHVNSMTRRCWKLIKTKITQPFDVWATDRGANGRNDRSVMFSLDENKSLSLFISIFKP